MVLSDMKHNMIVYMKGHDPSVKMNPPWNTYFEGTVINWTSHTAKIQLVYKDTILTRTFGELVDRLPDDVESVGDGMWQKP